jgi:hypothetical protein
MATWNVNSIRARAERVAAWLQRSDIDVLAIQETKCRDDQFPEALFTDLGYEVCHHGLSQWNGVAVASRVGLDDVRIGFPGQPGWGDGDKAEPEGHGAAATPLSTLSGRAVERRTLQEEREGTAAGLFEGPAGETPRIKPEDLAREMGGTNPPIVLDVRTRSQYERDKRQIPGSIRVPTDRVEDWAKRLIAESPDGEPLVRPVATYCT